MSTYFIGCLHLGHESMAKHRGFSSAAVQDDYLIHQWNKTISKKDKVYILGDVTMETNKFYYRLNLLKGTKVVVMGNHDLEKHSRDLLNYVDRIAGAVDYKGFLLTHVPIHPCEIGGYRGNVHAHTHQNKLQEVITNKLYEDDLTQINTLEKYYCVDAKLLDFRPRTLEQLLNENRR